MAEKDVEYIRKAMHSIKAANWSKEIKNAMLKNLDEQLKGYYVSVEKAESPIQVEYATARELVRKATMPADDKERMLTELDGLYGPELEKDFSEQKVRKAQIQKMIGADPQIKLLKSVAKARQRGEISQRDAMRFLSKAYDLEGDY